MKSLRITSVFLIAALIVSCNALSAPTQMAPAPTQTETAQTLTPTLVSQPSPTETVQPAAGPTATPRTGKPISMNGVTFTLPGNLGNGASSSIVPALLDAPYTHPAYLEIKLSSYPVISEYGQPARIEVYDAKAYAAQKSPDGDQDVNKTKAILDLPNRPLTRDVMPFSDLLFASNMRRLTGVNVSGMRMLSVRGNGMAAINNDDLDYQFSGITHDGKFFVVINLPITASFLPSLVDNEPSEEIINYPDFGDAASIKAYLEKATNLLNAAETAGTLSPSIAAMDALVQSLKIDSAQLSFAASPTCYAVGFVKDVTFPDGARVKPGKSFTKTWRLQNLGTCAWKGNYTLSFFTGEQMGGASPTAILQGDDTVLPGDTVDVSVNMQAPDKKGSYTGYWALKNDIGDPVSMADGSTFQLSVNIVVAP